MEYHEFNNSDQITFRHVEQTTLLWSLIEQEVQKLRHRHQLIKQCHVVIEKPHRRHRQGNQLRAQIIVTLPGKQLITSREIGGDSEEAAVRSAVIAAFSTLENLLQAFVHRHNTRARQHRYRADVNSLHRSRREPDGYHLEA